MTSQATRADANWLIFYEETAADPLSCNSLSQETFLLKSCHPSEGVSERLVKSSIKFSDGAPRRYNPSPGDPGGLVYLCRNLGGTRRGGRRKKPLLGKEGTADSMPWVSKN